MEATRATLDHPDDWRQVVAEIPHNELLAEKFAQLNEAENKARRHREARLMGEITDQIDAFVSTALQRKELWMAPLEMHLTEKQYGDDWLGVSQGVEEIVEVLREKGYDVTVRRATGQLLLIIPATGVSPEPEQEDDDSAEEHDEWLDSVLRQD